MQKIAPVHGIRPRSFGHADLCNGIQILLTILDCMRLTRLHENVRSVVDDGLASFAKVSNGIDRALFPGVSVGESDNGY